MLLRRMKVDFTVHGMRSAGGSVVDGRSGRAFEIAEACLAHTVGTAVVQAYQRSSLLELRRPVLQRWANFVYNTAASNVIPLRA